MNAIERTINRIRLMLSIGASREDVIERLSAEFDEEIILFCYVAAKMC